MTVRKSTVIFDVTVPENAKLAFNKTNNADGKLFDMDGQIIEIVGVYVEEYDEKDAEGEYVVNKKTGSVNKKYRTIIFTSDNKGYVSTSYGVYNVIRRMRTMGIVKVGMNPTKVKVVKGQLNGRTSLTLELA